MAPRTILDDATLDRATEEFRQQGFTALPRIFSRETIARALEDVERILASDIVGSWNARFHYWKGAERIPERIEPIVDLSDSIAGMCRDRNLTAVLTEILGDPPILLKDRVILRPPGTDGYHVHQDYVFYPFCNPNRMVSVAIALDPTTPENGALRFYPDRYCRSYTRWQPRFFSEAETASLREAGPAIEILQTPGEVILFHSLTPHESGENQTTGFRRLILLAYNALSEGDFYARHRKRYLTEIPDLGRRFQ